jgi:hypothetical protein
VTQPTAQALGAAMRAAIAKEQMNSALRLTKRLITQRLLPLGADAANFVAAGTRITWRFTIVKLSPGPTDRSSNAQPGAGSRMDGSRSLWWLRGRGSTRERFQQHPTPGLTRETSTTFEKDAAKAGLSSEIPAESAELARQRRPSAASYHEVTSFSFNRHGEMRQPAGLPGGSRLAPARAGEPYDLVLASDTLEGLAVRFNVHEPSVWASFHPVPVRVLDLRALTHRTVAVAIAGGLVSRHWLITILSEQIGHLPTRQALKQLSRLLSRP